jgi:hypothetical protein
VICQSAAERIEEPQGSTMAQACPGAGLRYQYQALKAPRSIRALEILSDRPDGRAAIEIAMHEIDLDQVDRRSFYALSYT